MYEAERNHQGRYGVQPGNPEGSELHPYRVEVKENSKGEPSVSVRATGDDADEAVKIALAMYQQTRSGLGLA